MWFGSEGGLCRYNGYDVVAYRPKEADSTSISGDIVGPLLLDSSVETIWAAATEVSTRTTPLPASSHISLHARLILLFYGDIPSNLSFRITQERSGLRPEADQTTFHGIRARHKFIRYLNNSNDSTSLSWNWVNAVSGDAMPPQRLEHCFPVYTTSVRLQRGFWSVVPSYGMVGPFGEGMGIHL